MRLIINSNPLISALIKDSISRKLIFHPQIELFTPDFSWEELEEHEEEIREKGNLSVGAFQALIYLLIEKIMIISREKYDPKMEEALQLISDRDDAPFLALALATMNDGLWSNDEGLKLQTKVKIWSTSELVKLFFPKA